MDKAGVTMADVETEAGVEGEAAEVVAGVVEDDLLALRKGRSL